MNRPFQRTLISAFAFLVASGNAIAATKAIRKEMNSLYQRGADAYKAKDIDRFMEDKTPDFQLKTLDGHVTTYSELKENLPGRWEHMQSINYLRVTIHSIRVEEREVVCTTEQEFSRTVLDAAGRQHVVVTKGTRHRDTWVRVDDQWRIRLVEELKQGKEYVDGKVVKTRSR